MKKINRGALAEAIERRAREDLAEARIGGASMPMVQEGLFCCEQSYEHPLQESTEICANLPAFCAKLRLTVSHKYDILRASKKGGLMRSSYIASLGGVPTLFVDGKALPGVAYITYFTDNNRYADFANAGFRLFSLPVYFSGQTINERT